MKPEIIAKYPSRKRAKRLESAVQAASRAKATDAEYRLKSLLRRVLDQKQNWRTA